MKLPDIENTAEEKNAEFSVFANYNFFKCQNKDFS
jgi:hypothetical protein